MLFYWKRKTKRVEISLRTTIRILEVAGMTVVTYGYGSEAWMFWGTEEDLLRCLPGNLLRIILSSRLTDHISNSKMPSLQQMYF